MESMIIIHRNETGYSAEHLGPCSEEIFALFGSRSLPTAYTHGTRPAAVRDAIEALNPGIEVYLDSDLLDEEDSAQDIHAPVCIGSIPRDADCSRTRHGIYYGLLAAFPGDWWGNFENDDCISFGDYSRLDRSTPVLTNCQVDSDMADKMADWVRGFCYCMVNYRS